MNFAAAFRRCLIVLITIFLFPVLTGSEPETAENFPVYNLKGERNIFYKLVDELPDNGLMLVNFTSVACLPCKKEIPELKAIVDGDSGRLRLMCIYAEAADKAKESATPMGVADVTFVDPFGAIQKKYNVTKYPVTFVIDKEYKILGRYDGYTQGNISKIKKICGI